MRADYKRKQNKKQKKKHYKRWSERIQSCKETKTNKQTIVKNIRKLVFT